MNISLIGSGNVATNLAIELINKGHAISQVYSRDINNATTLSNLINSKPTDNIDNTSSNTDIIIICVSDEVIDVVVKELHPTNQIVVHTAGSVAIDALNKFTNRGVFYPFQTFSKEKNIEFDQIPILIESSNQKTQTKLIQLGNSISKNVLEVNSQQRLNLHIAAVLSCNFVNHLYTISHQILDQNNLDFNLLHPLINETTEKISVLSPFHAQTGPAKRNDIKTINKHLDILKSNPEYYKLYELLTNSIIETYHKD